MCYTLCPTVSLLVVLRSGRQLSITYQPLGPPSGRVLPVQNTQVSFPYPTHSRCLRFRCLSPSIVPLCCRRSCRVRFAFPIISSFSGSHYPQLLTHLFLCNEFIHVLSYY